MTSETTEKEATKNKTSDSASSVAATTKDIAEKLEKLSKPVFEFICILLPRILQMWNKLCEIWNTLDDNIIKSITGFAFCFCGGMYPTVFAGVQAAEQGGRALLVRSLNDLSEEATRILNESEKDDQEIEKKKADLSNQEYMKRKTLFVLQKMNPDKVNTALMNLYKVWFAVIAVLVVQFAQTIQMANSIADFLTQPADHYVKPVVEAMIPREYHQWTPILMEWACKTVGMSLAWTLASIRAAFASSMQGGLMLSRSGLVALRQRNIDLGGFITVHDHSKTNLDEYVAYGFAALGFLFQLYFRLSPPFPLNIVLFPFHVAEWILRYGVMKASGAAM